jgi:hypothetical protein
MPYAVCRLNAPSVSQRQKQKRNRTSRRRGEVPGTCTICSLIPLWPRSAGRQLSKRRRWFTIRRAPVRLPLQRGLTATWEEGIAFKQIRQSPVLNDKRAMATDAMLWPFSLSLLMSISLLWNAFGDLADALPSVEPVRRGSEAGTPAPARNSAETCQPRQCHAFWRIKSDARLQLYLTKSEAK